MLPFFYLRGFAPLSILFSTRDVKLADYKTNFQKACAISCRDARLETSGCRNAFYSGVEVVLRAIRQASTPFSGKPFSLDIKARVRILFLLLLCLLWMLLGTFASAQPTNALPQVVVTGSTESLTSPGLNSVAERFHDVPGAVSVFGVLPAWPRSLYGRLSSVRTRCADPIVAGLAGYRGLRPRLVRKRMTLSGWASCSMASL